MRLMMLGTSLAFFVLWLSVRPVQAVPAAPNESLVHGEIVEVDAIDSLTLDIQTATNTLSPETAAYESDCRRR